MGSFRACNGPRNRGSLQASQICSEGRDWLKALGNVHCGNAQHLRKVADAPKPTARTHGVGTSHSALEHKGSVSSARPCWRADMRQGLLRTFARTSRVRQGQAAKPKLELDLIPEGIGHPERRTIISALCSKLLEALTDPQLVAEGARYIESATSAVGERSSRQPKARAAFEHLRLAREVSCSGEPAESSCRKHRPRWSCGFANTSLASLRPSLAARSAPRQ